MAITTNSLSITALNMTSLGAMKGFAWTPHDDNYIEDPNNADVQVVSQGISFAAATALAYTDVEGEEHTIPSGALAPGIIHPIRGIVRVLNTGTDATSVVIWI